MTIAWAGSHVCMSPGGPLGGVARTPGSKSLANRYLTCAALADGTTTLRGVSCSDDVRAMLDGLKTLGIDVAADEARETVTIRGCAGNIRVDEADLDVGHAGTAMRFLTALCSTGLGRYRIDGSARMRQRPIGPLVGALTELGAQIGYEDLEGYPPLTILGRGLIGGDVVFRTPPSSQFISAILMVAPYGKRDVTLRVDGPLPSRPYVDLTLAAMRELGVEAVAGEESRFVVPAFQRYRGREIEVEPDASGATYLWAAAALTGGYVTVPGLSRQSLQGDARFVDVLHRMGCVVKDTDEGLSVRAPDNPPLRGIEVDLNRMPDTVQTLAVLALFADGPTRITNVANLRIKETDRITALTSELTKLGARVDAWEDGLEIHPPAQVRPAEIETYDDHRMAMSFALVGLCVDGMLIRNAGCVSKSFPKYFDVLSSLIST